MGHKLFYHLIFVCSVVISCNTKEEKTVPPPNILWIVSEDNSPFLGAYGDEYATTPNLDKLASSSVIYDNAFAAAPVCAPTRSTIITGMYANSLGTQHMRSTYQIPEMVKFFPKYLREAGYYCTNNSKKDYNTIDQKEAWDESSREATYRNRKPGQRFFHIRNFTRSHESSIHDSIPMDQLKHDPEKAPIPPYHPVTPEMKHDWAQYYDRISQMDEEVGKILKELEEDGLADSTIIFYYSDHGGVIGRSKRFMFESGLHVPLIIHFPKAYQHLAPSTAGSRTDRLVSFVDFAPTVLSLAGLEVPEYMQGSAFLGKNEATPRDYAYSFRGRMDERFDMARSIRNKQYRYVRNYMPHRVYAQYIEYLWRAPSMRSWEREYKAGNLNEVQSVFWKQKPIEELYDITADPHNIKNLANDPAHQKALQEMRAANKEWLFDIRDAGFLPEPLLIDINSEQPIYTFTHSELYPLEDLYKNIEVAFENGESGPDVLTTLLEHDEPLVRYWGITACINLGERASSLKGQLINNLESKTNYVRTASAEALYSMGEKEVIQKPLLEGLQDDNLMARVQALNVLEIMGNDASFAAEKVKSMVDQAPEGNRDYDIRAAQRVNDRFKK